MLQPMLTDEPPPGGRTTPDVGDGGLDRIEQIQLARLAGAVLCKSPADLLAVAESNPMLIWEWLEAFRRERLKAETEAKFWTAAVATLATAVPPSLRSAAK